MDRIPSKKIWLAYESAKGKTFTQLTSDMSFRDQDGSGDYDHHAFNWLLQHGYFDRWLDKKSFVYRFKLSERACNLRPRHYI